MAVPVSKEFGEKEFKFDGHIVDFLTPNAPCRRKLLYRFTGFFVLFFYISLAIESNSQIIHPVLYVARCITCSIWSNSCVSVRTIGNVLHTRDTTYSQF